MHHLTPELAPKSIVWLCWSSDIEIQIEIDMDQAQLFKWWMFNYINFNIWNQDWFGSKNARSMSSISISISGFMQNFYHGHFNVVCSTMSILQASWRNFTQVLSSALGGWVATAGYARFMNIHIDMRLNHWNRYSRIELINFNHWNQ